jgi:hypothetical protein
MVDFSLSADELDLSISPSLPVELKFESSEGEIR